MAGSNLDYARLLRLGLDGLESELADTPFSAVVPLLRATLDRYAAECAEPDPALHAGSVQNMKFSRDWFGPMRPKFDTLLRAWFTNGGYQAMISVVSADDLEAAMSEPENFKLILTSPIASEV